MIHTMKHDSIKFSSTNPRQVEFYETTLKAVSASAIKENKIEGRHQLMVNMGLAGNCPLSEDYFHARGKVQGMKDDFIDRARGSKYSMINYNGKEMFVLDAASLHAEDRVYDLTGWRLSC